MLDVPSGHPHCQRIWPRGEVNPQAALDDLVEVAVRKLGDWTTARAYNCRMAESPLPLRLGLGIAIFSVAVLLRLLLSEVIVVR